MSTVNIAARVQALAGYEVQPELAAMKGVSEKMGVYKITVQNQENP